MGQALPIARASSRLAIATSRDEVSAITICANSRENPKRKWFPILAQLISRDKPASYIAHLTAEKERTSYDWCKGEVDPPSRVVIKLLHSPVGWIVLEYLMRGCKQPWWLDLQRAKHCAAAYEQARGQLQFDM